MIFQIEVKRMLTNGIDLIRIARIEKSMKNKHFMEKVFGEAERKELEARKMPVQSVAAAFAAKEAFGKAMGVGIGGFSLCEVQVLHRGNGAPYLCLSGRAGALVKEKGAQLALSVSHDGEYAVAMVTCYGKGEKDYDENINGGADSGD